MDSRQVKDAREQWRQSVELLRAARRDFVAAAVPMDPDADGDPPVWTSDQSNAVMAYGLAWGFLAAARTRWEHATDGSRSSA